MRKPRIDPVRWQPPPVDSLPDFPSADITVVPLPGNGPEDVVVDAIGRLWAGLEDGRIVRIPPDGGEPIVVADTGCRPLGLHVARDGRLLVCDSHRGLLTLDPDSGTLETLVQSAFNFCNICHSAAPGNWAADRLICSDDGLLTFCIVPGSSGFYARGADHARGGGRARCRTGVPIPDIHPAGGGLLRGAAGR